MRVTIKAITDEKAVTINITDLEKIREVKELAVPDLQFFDDLHDFLADVHDSNEDAGGVEITPENVRQVLGYEEKSEEPSDTTADTTAAPGAGEAAAPPKTDEPHAQASD